MTNELDKLLTELQNHRGFTAEEFEAAKQRAYFEFEKRCEGSGENIIAETRPYLNPLINQVTKLLDVTIKMSPKDVKNVKLPDREIQTREKIVKILGRQPKTNIEYRIDPDDHSKGEVVVSFTTYKIEDNWTNGH